MVVSTLSPMPTWRSVLLILATTAVAASAPATASAFEHVVSEGESLSSIAAADGLSVSQLAAANGLSSGAQIVTGSSLVIPPQHAAVGESAGSPASSAPDSEASEPVTSGGYVVQPGDTLSAIAARLGVSVDSLAAANGLNPSGVLVSGTTLHGVGATASTAPASTSAASASAPPAPAEPVSQLASGTGAQPTSDRVSPSQVGSIAASEGVSPSLLEAVGYQESGFNNGMVSSTGATGVMQIEPATWRYIGQHLAGPPPLSPTSVTDNIRAGALLMHSLLNATGGDPAMAVAGYYQGLDSIRAHGVFPDTQAYVNSVLALRQRFGGG